MRWRGFQHLSIRHKLLALVLLPLLVVLPLLSAVLLVWGDTALPLGDPTLFDRAVPLPKSRACQHQQGAGRRPGERERAALLAHLLR